MLIGADYYPEHWDRTDWEPHAALMAQGGFKIVRMAEFAWSKMEPREGRYDFGWLDEALGVLRKHNILAILGTPTAVPPPWMVKKNPEILPVDQDGVRKEAGGRRHYCFSIPVYREFSRRIVTALAGHYADHPSVIGWQIDNEIGGPKCWCPSCERSFRDWLKERYQTLENLNRAWGTIFWGQEFSDWEEIPLPRPRHASHGPGIRLDHQRFHSSLVVGYHDMQVDVIRKLSPGKKITHNCMGFYNEVDYGELAKKLDFVSFDFYPGNVWGSGKSQGAPLDYTRSLKHKPWWVMEQRAGLTGWLDIFQSGDRPGQLRLWTYQAVAHGADAVVYFRWRTSRFGAEQYWHGILDHHGQPGRRYQELSRVGREFAALGDRLEGAEVAAPIGIMVNPDARWAMEIQRGNPAFNYIAHVGLYHQAFAANHIGVEFYQTTDDLSRCRILIAPALFVCDEKQAARLTDYVQNGGTLVLTFRSGVKDENNVVINDRLPGLLQHLTGCTVEEYDALVSGETVGVEMLPPLPRSPGRASIWCDQLRLTGARALLRYSEGPFAGSPAATLNRYGKGQVIYVGFHGDRTFYGALTKWLLSQHGLKSPVAPSDTIEITERVKGKERFLFVLNHSAEKQKLALPARTNYRDLLTGQKSRRTVSLRPYDVKILAPVQIS
jgi:beta-galactosidase